MTAKQVGSETTTFCKHYFMPFKLEFVELRFSVWWGSLELKFTTNTITAITTNFDFVQLANSSELLNI